LQQALLGRDVIELTHDEVRVAHLWPRGRTRVAVPDIRGFFLLPGQGVLMARTPGGSIRVSEMGRGDERAALAGALRELLELPAHTTWQPALPAGYVVQDRPEGTAVVPSPHPTATEWLIGPGTVSVLERTAESDPGVIFAGSAAELTASQHHDDDGDPDYLVCQLALLGEDRRQPGSGRCVLLETQSDPSIPREAGMWLAAHAEIAFHDRIEK
jgi:hypothetical protein